ncbi:MAG: hypothetical protein PHO67_03955 [Candidatus Omnitrophica bacterium]|nr:hypothetical protein [Candidatus Omnitrophota bacterium]
MTIVEIADKIANNAWYGVIFIAGLVTKYVFDLYKNKISKLQYSINKSLLGASNQDNYLGNVQVLYNGKPVENLYLCNINLVNTSNKDFKDIEITVWSDIDSIILVSNALKAKSIYALSLTQAYVEQSKTITDQNVKLINSRRPYLIPVLNRDDSITFSCLVTNPNKAEPNIYLNCDFPGLKIEPTFTKPKLFWRENQDTAALYGLLITAIISIFVTHYLQSKAIIALIIFILAAFLLIPGVIVLKILKRIRKLIR